MKATRFWFSTFAFNLMHAVGARGTLFEEKRKKKLCMQRERNRNAIQMMDWEKKDSSYTTRGQNDNQMMNDPVSPPGFPPPSFSTRKYH
jgi:hypothetical protein